MKTNYKRKLKVSKLMSAILSCVTLTLVACSAQDFGRGPSLSFEVNVTNPTWELDIQPVVNAKCSSCHTSDPSEFIPANVPKWSRLEKLNVKSVFDAMGQDILNRMQDANKPMPPTFATPLTDNEKLAMTNYFLK